MKFIELVGHMGQPPDQADLLAHFRSLAITRQPRPDEGEDTAYVQFVQEGYEMRFDRVPNQLGLQLRSITAYPAGDATHAKFEAELPQNIQASDLREQVHAKLGAPAFHNKIFFTDMWKLGSLDLVVRYDKATQHIKIVQVNVP